MIPRRRPPAPPPPKPAPFAALPKPRVVPATLPSDLAAFYRAHEGVGRAASHVVYPVRVNALAEVVSMTAADLPPPAEGGPGWGDWRGLRVGVGQLADPIVYVLAGPAYRFGSIVAFGADVSDAGALVLADNWTDWLARLKRDEWVEMGFVRAGWGGLPKGKAEALRRHFGRLNPGQAWGPPEVTPAG